MAVLFVSHASKDDRAAADLETWLRAHRFTDVFIDHSNIVGGEVWAQALRDAAAACRVIICLVTDNWLGSDECFGEFKAAWYMGKPIIPLLALREGGATAHPRLAKVIAEHQGFDVAACMTTDGRLDLARDPRIERGLEAGLRAAGALAEVGLDPEAFAIDRALRPLPFPGLASFSDHDADAAVFYGRSREIAEVLEQLRKMRADGDKRPLAILGASGAGKSSLLRAGVIPRLRRERPAWLPLRTFRPGADPLLNFAQALARTRADYKKAEAYGAIRDRLLDAWRRAERDDTELTPAGNAALVAALDVEGAKLRNAAACPAATILMSIDQAEELMRADVEAGNVLADCLRALMISPTSGWQLAFTVRTDSFPELQRHRRFRDLQACGYDLRPLPTFRFADVIEKPARRYGLVIDVGLADSLMEDAPKEDALPLLAFALQRLWRLYAEEGILTRSHYQNVGRLTGLIENAAERALRGIEPEQDEPMSDDALSERSLALCASTFVPALAHLNDRGATIRCIAQWKDFRKEQQDLLTCFEHWRLVLRRGTDVDGGTVEVAHEALFREWTRLKSWLEPERARLEVVRSLQTAAASWDRNLRGAGFLDHRGPRLAAARALTHDERYKRRLTNLDHDYLNACRWRALGRQARTLAAGVFAMLVLALGYVALADDGIAVPGAGPLQAYIDRYALSVFRPVRDDGAMLRAARPAGDYIVGRLSKEMTGGRWMVSNHTRRVPVVGPSVWLTSQAATGLLHSLGPQAPGSDASVRALAGLFEPATLVEANGKKFGWLRDDNRYPISHPTFWTIAALAIALGRTDPAVDGLRGELLQRLDYAQGIADLYRPTDDGGWNAFPQQLNPAEHSTYVATLALLALLELRNAGLGWHGDKPRLESMLRATATWLENQFEDQDVLPGWRVHLNEGGNINNGPVSDGLTLQIYSELLRAEEAANVAIPDQILAAIPRHLNLVLSWRSAYPLSNGTVWQDFTNYDGEPMTQTVTENYLWYPWAIECAVQWLRRLQRAGGSAEAVLQARRVLGYLLVDLGTEKLAPATLDRNAPYDCSEELYALGTAMSYLATTRD